ncbi:unnamed protein product [Rotaria sordida]|uniref:Uncharacterized protein n=1 Tax=Rotaria sordida TaxID=392033 RepID=A0A814EQZ5_9BILA|nr:unnamed protein product [Rotaria sordida]CAF0971414.1 unnamed protein product [Rotaria sordida]CAF3495299.1 unnamed protein product [Rotaria sordida]CAF3629825.1 unnamed protein product [Rotaria sordida]
MAFTKKQQIRGIRILLTVFYGFLLSSIIFRYIIHGIVQTIRRPTNPYAITMIVLGTIILISIALAIYATWFDNTTIMLVSGAVLICVFILTLIFGIIRIIKTAPTRVVTATAVSNVVIDGDVASDAGQAGSVSKTTTTTDSYAIIEDVTQLIVELISILFAILATFVLFRYVKTKYAAVPTTETKTTS